MTLENTITFDESAKKAMLSIFGTATDKEGYLIDSDTRKRVLASDGKEIKYNEFAGVKRGEGNSIIYVRNDLLSLIELADHAKHNS